MLPSARLGSSLEGWQVWPLWAGIFAAPCDGKSQQQWEPHTVTQPQILYVPIWWHHGIVYYFHFIFEYHKTGNDYTLGRPTLAKHNDNDNDNDNIPVNMTVQIRYRICTIFYRFVPAVPDIGARYKNGTVLVSASITGQYRLSGTGQYRFHTNIRYRDITVHQFRCYQQGTFCSQN